MPVNHIQTREQYVTLKDSSPLLVVDFYATWCGPCKSIGPVFDRLSSKPESGACSFARVDVDRVQSLAQECGITAMPTFLFFRNGTQVDELKGADPRALETKLNALILSSVKSTSTLVRGMIVLNDKIDVKQLEVLNLDSSSVLRSLIDPSSTESISSETDEQLMIYLSFQESVKVHSIRLRVDPGRLSYAPAELRIFANRPNILTFDDVDAIPSTQKISTSDILYDGEGAAIVGLRYVKFQKVNSLVIFVERNGGEEEVTMMRSIEFLGSFEAANSSGVVKKIEDHE